MRKTFSSEAKKHVSNCGAEQNLRAGFAQLKCDYCAVSKSLLNKKSQVSKRLELQHYFKSCRRQCITHETIVYSIVKNCGAESNTLKETL